MIVAQGFYEWKTVGATSGAKKQPYLIFAHQDANVKVADATSWTNGKWSPAKGWTGPKILKMAGLYDVWTSPKVSVWFMHLIMNEPITNPIHLIGR